jgi:hypothetical protein
MLISLLFAVAVGDIVFKKPEITIQWGAEKIIYSANLTEQEIRADLQRRADEQYAHEDQQFQKLTQEQKDFCDRNSKVKFDQLPQYCQTYAFHGSKIVIPEGWQDQLHFRRTLGQEAYLLALWMFGPPTLILLVGSVFPGLRGAFGT